ncbi:MAG TPA: hypothetical protein VF263_23210, partial [Longimicrobiaceae bacterium]
MATVNRDIYVQVLTFQPAQGRMVPVPGATVLCKDSRWLIDKKLSGGSDVSGADGVVEMTVSFEDTEESGLTPYFVITVPEAARAVPAAEPRPERKVHLPGEWETRHHAGPRLRLADFTTPERPLKVYVGLHARLRVAYTDYDASGIRNPLALPVDTVRVYLADYDDFLWIDWLNPDDTMTGEGYDPRRDRVVPFGEGDRYPYFDAWPTAPSALDGLADALPHAWIDPPGTPVGTLGGGSFQAAGAVATDPHGFVFLVDGDVVRRFYPDGTLCETITGGFRNPGGVAVDQFRNLYVADTDNHRVRVFFPDQRNGGSDTYTHHHTFGSRGAAPGDFDRPRGLAVIPAAAVDGEELLAVADTDNHRVQVFRIHVSGPSADVSLRAQTISSVTPVSHAVVGGAGAFTTPVAVAGDRQRRLYVCDSGLNRVSRFTPNADATAFAGRVDWGLAAGAAGAGPREFNAPRSIALDRKHGHLYVADAGNRRVQRLDAESGSHLADWAPVLPAPFAPESVAVDARGEVYVSDAANKRVVRGTPFEAAGARRADTAAPAQVGAPWTPADDPAHMRAPGYVHFGADGKLWVSDTDNDRVLTFERNPAGVLVLAAGRIDAGLDGPVGVAIDPEGGVFVADSGNNRIRRYGAALAHAADLGAPGAADGQLADPRGLAVAQRVEPVLYVADRGNDRVQVLRRDGTFVAKLEEGDGRRMSAPEDVAVDAAGAVYVADTGNGRILRYTVGADGTHAFSRAIPVPVKAAGTTPAPCGISTDRDGNLVVTDRAQEMVLLLETDGDLLAYWDLRILVQLDIDTDRFFYPALARLQMFGAPARAVVDDRGLLAVADTGNDRVRLVRIHTEVHANLYDLGEGLPDVSFRAVTKADWREDLGLKVNVGDVS